MKTTLIIMAAGIGSRFGTGIKQLAKMGPSGELIMDYSVFDARAAGFDKVVFIIRHAIEKEFIELIGNRIGKYIEVSYVFQETDDLPAGFSLPVGRVKPWGTGHAVLCCSEVVKEPFVIINADDYYGKDVFLKLHDFLIHGHESADICHMAMVAFRLCNTLSDNGRVTRGICLAEKNADGECDVARILETKGIVRDAQGRLVCEREDARPYLSEDALVSMNIWAGYPRFFEKLREGFVDFLKSDAGDLLQREYLIPEFIDRLIAKRQAKVKLMITDEKWIGITYHEDVEAAQKSFLEMIQHGKYKTDLWNG